MGLLNLILAFQGIHNKLYRQKIPFFNHLFLYFIIINQYIFHLKIFIIIHHNLTNLQFNHFQIFSIEFFLQKKNYHLLVIIHHINHHLNPNFENLNFLFHLYI